MTKIYLDSGNPAHTKIILDVSDTVAGQTTNPSLVAKSDIVAQRISEDKKFTQTELLDVYKNIVQQIDSMASFESISIEVYADSQTTAESMVKQGKDMASWTPNACIKLPITAEGLKAAHILTNEGYSVNMTLCFTQEQAAAVYCATRNVKPGSVLISPFVGRLDDNGYDGVSMVKNCIQMFNEYHDSQNLTENHVRLLMASIRNVKHIQAGFDIDVDIMTIPFQLLQQYFSGENQVNEKKQKSEKALTEVKYKELDLNNNWQDFNIFHPLTDKGLQKFADDWNALLI